MKNEVIREKADINYDRETADKYRFLKGAKNLDEINDLEYEDEVDKVKKNPK